MLLPQVWEYLNEVAFGGELNRPPILLYKRLYLEKAKLLGAYHPTLGIYLGYWKRKRKETLYYTLFHEMCHQFIYEVLGDDHTGHGELFKKVFKEGLRRLEKRSGPKARFFIA